MAQVLSAFHFHPWSSTWCLLFDSTSPLSTSSSSSCPSSFPSSSSSTSSWSLSSTTRRTWQSCAAPRRTRVRTLMTSSTLQQGTRGMAMSPPRWLCCGLAACCTTLVVCTGCRLSEHTCQGPRVCRDAQANLVQPSLSSDSLRLCTSKCTGPG